FRLQAVGTDSTYTENKISKIKATIPHEILINLIEFQNNHKNINTLPFEDITASSLEKSKFMALPTDTLLTEKQISRMSKRITALGETVHGSNKIGLATCEFIKSSVLNNRTTLILFEQPLLKMFFFNKYIQGDDSIDENKLKQLMEMNLYEVEPMVELAKWLRKYNKTAIEKVSFWGNDCQYERNELGQFLKDYLQTINKEARSSAVDTIISVLKTTDAEKIKEIAKTTQNIIDINQQELTDVLGKDLNIITFYLESLMKADVTNKNSYYERDYNMFKNTSFLIDYLCKPNQTVVISCHLMHANYLTPSIPFHKSFGSYMKKNYGNDYVCIAQTVYQDTVKAFTGKELERKALTLPSSNSIEAIFSKSGIKYGYINAKELDEIVKLRMQGSHHIPSSEIEKYINPRNQIQGVLFIN
ncbi:MAG: erythromycin esterase family protein, partial [Paludibacter sp.]|nr:erythromycin esterase family protein [Paludibacter sp.]